MCPANQSTRRSARRIAPGDRLTQSAKEFFPTTTSTSPPSNKSAGGVRISRLADDDRSQEAQRIIRPITGIFREISADYQVCRTVIGRGHYGIVRKCKHRATHRILAVKSVDKSKVRKRDYLGREVYLLHQINHQSIMKMVDCYEDAKYVHIVTERYTGGELFDQIEKNTTPEGCFSERKAASIIRSLLEAVVYLHDNDIVHRDIKPENVLFETSREGAPIRLIDFGLSRKHKRGQAPMDNAVGTVYYMAPEVLEEKYDRSCDIWSVGTIAYILLCGYPPFNAENDDAIFKCIKKGKFDFPQTAWSSKSGDAKDFINYLLRKDPRKRPTARKALSHTWLKTNVSDGSKSNDAKQHEDLMTKIQKLRLTICNFKKHALVGRS